MPEDNNQQSPERSNYQTAGATSSSRHSALTFANVASMAALILSVFALLIAFVSVDNNDRQGHKHRPMAGPMVGGPPGGKHRFDGDGRWGRQQGDPDYRGQEGDPDYRGQGDYNQGYQQDGRQNQSQ